MFALRAAYGFSTIWNSAFWQFPKETQIRMQLFPGFHFQTTKTIVEFKTTNKMRILLLIEQSSKDSLQYVIVEIYSWVYCLEA